MYSSALPHALLECVLLQCVALLYLSATAIAYTLCAAPKSWISTQADTDLLLPCTNLTGTLTLSPYFSGSFSLPNLLIAEYIYISSMPNVSLTAISFPKLVSLSGSFILLSNNVTTLDLSSVEWCGRDFNLDTPSLQTWNGSETMHSTSNLLIQNHNITSLSFMNLRFVSKIDITFSSPGGSLTINGTMDSTTNDKCDIRIQGYSDTKFTSYLPSHGYLILSGLSSISISAIVVAGLIVQNNPLLANMQLESLRTISGPTNYSTAVPSVFPREEEADGSDVLIIAFNNILSFAWFPVLQTIEGSLQIMRNPLLTCIGISGVLGMKEPEVRFQALESVTGSILVEGNFKAIKLPCLSGSHGIGGHMNITTTDSSFNCSSLYPFYDLGILKEMVLICVTPTGNYSLPEALSPTPTASYAKSGMPKKEMIGVGVGVALAALFVSSALGYWLIRVGSLGASSL